MYADRAEAGRRLAAALEHLRGQDAVVLGLPRGGVPVAVEVSSALGLPLDLLLVRKLGMPGQPELAMGAIGEGGVRVLDHEVLAAHPVPEDLLADVERRESAELARRSVAYRAGADGVPLAGRIALVVDDGIATGSTVRAACQVARAHGARRVVLAAPVAPRSVVRDLRRVADEVVVLETPWDFYAVGQFYADFRQLTDDDVVRLLQRER